MKQKLSAYLRLIRIHRPAGIWLLLWPCLWSAASASITQLHTLPHPTLLLLFAVGAFLMRSAGCIVNDLADKDFDKHVERTRTRPLASGEISTREALGLLMILLCLSLLVAISMGWKIVALGACWLPLVAAYPFMKRFTWWPQAFLGLTFNAGAIFGWVAVTGTLTPAPLVLYLGAIFWTIGYDTLYAVQDMDDDARIGVRSTARLFGKQAPACIALCYFIFLCCLIYFGDSTNMRPSYALFISLTAAHLFLQVWRMTKLPPQRHGELFSANIHTGAIIFLAIIADAIFALFF